MNVLKATQEKYNLLNGFENKISKLEFIKDANNNWVVNEAVLYDHDFIDIRTDLEMLPIIEYQPKIYPI